MAVADAQVREALAVRPERDSREERAAVREVLEAAFPTPAEADLVGELREREPSRISWVATIDDQVVGCIVFTPVHVREPAQDAGGGDRDRAAELGIYGLAPMAVVPRLQSSGIGTRLVEEGLAACRGRGVDAVVVLGHPTYYPRFGFQPASRFGLRSTFDVPDEVFRVLELRAGCLQGVGGTVHYHPAFDELD